MRSCKLAQKNSTAIAAPWRNSCWHTDSHYLQHSAITSIENKQITEIQEAVFWPSPWGTVWQGSELVLSVSYSCEKINPGSSLPHPSLLFHPSEFFQFLNKIKIGLLIFLKQASFQRWKRTGRTTLILCPHTNIDPVTLHKWVLLYRTAWTPAQLTSPSLHTWGFQKAKSRTMRGTREQQGTPYSHLIAQGRKLE